MDATTYAELTEKISCGEFRCLQDAACCTEVFLLELRDTLKPMSQRDIVLFAKMLCGCKTSPKAPSDPGKPTISSCVNDLVGWIKTNRRTMTAIQTALDVAEGLVGDPRIALAIGALSSSLEAIEDLAISTEGTPVDEIVDVVCGIENGRRAILRALRDLAPEFAKPAAELLEKLSELTSLAARCCDATVPIVDINDEPDGIAHNTPYARPGITV